MLTWCARRDSITRHVTRLRR